MPKLGVVVGTQIDVLLKEFSKKERKLKNFID
jgi:hypothetical protein